MTDPIVRMEHARKAGMCSRGIRQWFTSKGLDYAQFLKDGLPASEVEALDDALAKRAAQIARDEAGGA